MSRARARASSDAVTIHATALVDRSAELAAGVEIGPFAIVGPGVKIGANTHVGPRVLIARDTAVGKDCRIENAAVLGTDSQDFKYQGETTFLEVGDRTVIREFATLHRGTGDAGKTIVGSDCYLMAYSHVAHDCELGSHVVVSNATNMAGHVTIEDWAFVSGLVAIHQFVRIGAHAFVGGGSRIPKDVPPYCQVVGNPSPKLYGLNSVGLERRGFSHEVRRRLRRAYRILFQSNLNLSQAIAQVEADSTLLNPEVGYFIDFIRKSKRGVTF